MIRLGFLLRRSTSNTNNLYSKLQVNVEKCFSTNKSSSSSSSNSSEDESRKVEAKRKSLDAREKLNLLLNNMIKEDKTVSNKPKLDLAKARRQKRKDLPKEPGTESVKTEPVEKKLVKAVQDVAKTVSGDVKQTESELLQKLLNPVKDESAKTSPGTLSDIFKDMKIDRQTKAGEDISRAEQVRQLLKQVKTGQQSRPKGAPPRRVARQSHFQQSTAELLEERVNLFDSKPLGIFPTVEEVASWPDQEVNKTWNALHERELRLAVTHPPSNYFQQMILWTEQGKLWKFPIDNEQDLKKEKSVYFTEHVFLEKHLEPWCPPKGPIRHFMELVCVGLSKNYYLTVEEKKEHILWFKNYFAEKEQLLHEVGALPPGFDINKKDAKQIDG